MARYANLDRIYSGRGTVANPGEQSITSRIMILDVAWGISAEWAVQLTVPWLDQTFRDSAGENRRQGWGEPSLLARWLPATNITARLRWFLAFGLSLPVGKGVVNPVSSDRNLVSETLDPLLIAGVVWLPGLRTSVDASLYLRPILSESGDGTRTGGVLQFATGANYAFVANGLQGRAALQVIHRRPDRLGGAVFASSGGTWAYLSPALTWIVTGQGAHGMHLSVGAEVPVYRNVRGTQLGESSVLVIRLFWGLPDTR